MIRHEEEPNTVHTATSLPSRRGCNAVILHRHSTLWFLAASYGAKVQKYSCIVALLTLLAEQATNMGCNKSRYNERVHCNLNREAPD